MKTTTLLSVAVAAIVLSGCAREDRWTLSSSSRSSYSTRTTQSPDQGDLLAIRSLRLVDANGGYLLRNTGDRNIIATLQATPAPQQGPLAGQSFVEALVLGNSEVRVGSHEYRIVNARYAK